MALPDPAIQATRTALDREFAPRAARARDEWPVDIADTEIAGVSCQVSMPRGDAPLGTVLYFFGGGYVSGDPEYELPITSALAAKGNLRVVAPRYALAPEHPFPAGLDQCRAVYAALSETGPLALSGESAGGGMALAVARLTMAEGGAPPARLALFSPWADMTGAGIAGCEGVDDPTLTVDDLHLCSRAYRGAVSADDPRASPGLGPLPPDWPPTLLTTGSRDLLGPMVRALAARLPDVHLIDRADMWHVFELYHERPEALETLDTAAVFLGRGFTR